MKNKVLVIAAHPDDEVLGCGATIKRLVETGAEVFTLILSAGKSSREDDDISTEQRELKNEMLEANRSLGVKEVYTADFPDNAFDSVPLLKIVKRIEEVKDALKPNMMFTHHIGDMNIDHQITHGAVLTATRPMAGEVVKEVLSFEVPSSTEWNSFSKESIFVPNVFYDVTKSIDDKIAAMAIYKSELRDYPHPRSLEYIGDIAKVWGAKIGVGRAEAFCLVRSIV